jgi:methylase of polypeptide subunit release factors
MVWTEDGLTHSALWHSESSAPAPRRVEVVDDAMRADVAYRLARKGTGLLWRGDYHNAKQLLTALGKRADRDAARRGRGAGNSAAQLFTDQRAQRAERARILGALIVVLDAGSELRLRRAPDVALACQQAYGEVDEARCVSLNELLGVLSAWQWQQKGVPVPFLDAHIHPAYGVFSPVRGEYLQLAAEAPILEATSTAFDLGTGTGVLAAILARRGVESIIATDINPRAVRCARENVQRLGYSARIRVQEADLFPDSGQADLIVCNPPWLPAEPTSALEQGVYDPDSSMLRRFLDGLPSRLTPDGEAWLIISDLAVHLGLRTRDDLHERIREAGLQVVGRLDTTPRHARVKDSSDPLHAARSQEVTTLWRLARDPG